MPGILPALLFALYSRPAWWATDHGNYFGNGPLSAGAGACPNCVGVDTGPSRTGPVFSSCMVCASEH